MAPQKARTPYRASPPGIAAYPWLNKPDVKFNVDGVFKTGLVVEGAEAQKLKEQLDVAAQKAFEEETADMAPAERKKWGIYVPYEEEETDDGHKTGRITFNFKQNAVIKVEGEPKPIKIAIFDAADKEVHTPIFGGSTIRVMFRERNTKIAASKKIGVKLDFLKVQLIKLHERKNDSGFGAVEGGYVGDDEDTGSFEGNTQSAPTAETEY